jgi:peptide deformylase
VTGPTALRMTYIGNPLLRRKAEPVTEFGSVLEALLPRMIEILRVEGGVGLAAPQAGLSKHFFILVANIDDEEREADDIQLMANAEILEASRGEVVIEEGCLSVPGLRADVSRPESVRIAYDDIRGERHELEATGILARVIQHETDHCEGVLFIDRLSAGRRALLRREIDRITAEYAGR